MSDNGGGRNRHHLFNLTKRMTKREPTLTLFLTLHLVFGLVRPPVDFYLRGHRVNLETSVSGILGNPAIWYWVAITCFVMIPLILFIRKQTKPILWIVIASFPLYFILLLVTANTPEPQLLITRTLSWTNLLTYVAILILIFRKYFGAGTTQGHRLFGDSALK